MPCWPMNEIENTIQQSLAAQMTLRLLIIRCKKLCKCISAPLGSLIKTLTEASDYHTVQVTFHIISFRNACSSTMAKYFKINNLQCLLFTVIRHIKRITLCLQTISSSEMHFSMLNK